MEAAHAAAKAFVHTVGSLVGWNVFEAIGGGYGVRAAPDGPRDARTPRPYRCLCDCGGRTVVAGHALTSGNTRSWSRLNRAKLAALRRL